ncbi:MAG: isochorismate synthase [Sterolibacterium sp.]
MIDWHAVSRDLARIGQYARPARLLSVAFPLPRWPGLSLPENDDWLFWQRPDRRLRLFGLGRACAATSAGAGRFAALDAAQRGLAESWLYAADSAAKPLAFTGFAFSPSDGYPLPNAALWVPELLLCEKDGACWATLSCAANQAGEALARWRTLWQALQALQAKPADVAGTPYVPLRNPLAEQAFLSRGRAALRAIAAAQAEKFVLTRSQRLRSDAPVAVSALLAALADRHPACATFGVGHNGTSFIGTSPETLLELEGGRVAVDALAGTAWQEAGSPLGTDKNHREHDLVAYDVAAALATLCHDVAVPAAPEVMRLNALTHLRRRITARRQPQVSVFDLIGRLHPTPAVGGTPTAVALDWLERHGDRRGAWYTGGFGWIDAAGDCDVAVALRCGLFEGCEATLYAGAGFVAGSDPQQELAETEAKFSAMRTALAAAYARDDEERAA